MGALTTVDYYAGYYDIATLTSFDFSSTEGNDTVDDDPYTIYLQCSKNNTTTTQPLILPNGTQGNEYNVILYIPEGVTAEFTGIEDSYTSICGVELPQYTNLMVVGGGTLRATGNSGASYKTSTWSTTTYYVGGAGIGSTTTAVVGDLYLFDTIDLVAVGGDCKVVDSQGDYEISVGAPVGYNTAYIYENTTYSLVPYYYTGSAYAQQTNPGNLYYNSASVGAPANATENVSDKTAVFTTQSYSNANAFCFSSSDTTTDYTTAKAAGTTSDTIAEYTKADVAYLATATDLSESTSASTLTINQYSATSTLNTSWTSSTHFIILSTPNLTSTDYYSITTDAVPALDYVQLKAMTLFTGYYTEEGGKGTQVFDENGICLYTASELAAYATNGVLDIYPFWENASFYITMDFSAIDNLEGIGEVTVGTYAVTDNDATDLDSRDNIITIYLGTNSSNATTSKGITITSTTPGYYFAGWAENSVETGSDTYSVSLSVSSSVDDMEESNIVTFSSSGVAPIISSYIHATDTLTIAEADFPENATYIDAQIAVYLNGALSDAVGTVTLVDDEGNVRYAKYDSTAGVYTYAKIVDTAATPTTYQVYVDGAKTGQTITFANETSAAASLYYTGLSVSTTKNGTAYSFSDITLCGADGSVKAYFTAEDAAGSYERMVYQNADTQYYIAVNGVQVTELFALNTQAAAGDTAKDITYTLALEESTLTTNLDGSPASVGTVELTDSAGNPISYTGGAGVYSILQAADTARDPYTVTINGVVVGTMSQYQDLTVDYYSVRYTLGDDTGAAGTLPATEYYLAGETATVANAGDITTSTAYRFFEGWSRQAYDGEEGYETEAYNYHLYEFGTEFVVDHPYEFSAKFERTDTYNAADVRWTFDDPDTLGFGEEQSWTYGTYSQACAVTSATTGYLHVQFLQTREVLETDPEGTLEGQIPVTEITLLPTHTWEIAGQNDIIAVDTNAEYGIGQPVWLFVLDGTTLTNQGNLIVGESAYFATVAGNECTVVNTGTIYSTGYLYVTAVQNILGEQEGSIVGGDFVTTGYATFGNVDAAATLTGGIYSESIYLQNAAMSDFTPTAGTVFYVSNQSTATAATATAESVQSSFGGVLSYDEPSGTAYLGGNVQFFIDDGGSALNFFVQTGPDCAEESGSYTMEGTVQLSVASAVQNSDGSYTAQSGGQVYLALDNLARSPTASDYTLVTAGKQSGITLNAVESEAYTFAGWYTGTAGEGNLTLASTDENFAAPSISESTTYTAVFEAVDFALAVATDAGTTADGWYDQKVTTNAQTVVETITTGEAVDGTTTDTDTSTDTNGNATTVTTTVTIATETGEGGAQTTTKTTTTVTETTLAAAFQMAVNGAQSAEVPLYQKLILTPAAANTEAEQAAQYSFYGYLQMYDNNVTVTTQANGWDFADPDDQADIELDWFANTDVTLPDQILSGTDETTGADIYQDYDPAVHGIDLTDAAIRDVLEDNDISLVATPDDFVSATATEVGYDYSLLALSVKEGYAIYDLNGGSWATADSSTPLEYALDSDSDVYTIIPTTPEAPASGYHFIGWHFMDDDTQFYAANTAITLTAEQQASGITLVALYAQDSEELFYLSKDTGATGYQSLDEAVAAARAAGEADRIIYVKDDSTSGGTSIYGTLPDGFTLESYTGSLMGVFILEGNSLTIGNATTENTADYSETVWQTGATVAANVRVRVNGGDVYFDGQHSQILDQVLLTTEGDTLTLLSDLHPNNTLEICCNKNEDWSQTYWSEGAVLITTSLNYDGDAAPQDGDDAYCNIMGGLITLTNYSTASDKAGAAQTDYVAYLSVPDDTVSGYTINLCAAESVIATRNPLPDTTTAYYSADYTVNYTSITEAVADASHLTSEYVAADGSSDTGYTGDASHNLVFLTGDTAEAIALVGDVSAASTASRLVNLVPADAATGVTLSGDILIESSATWNLQDNNITVQGVVSLQDGGLLDVTARTFAAGETITVQPDIAGLDLTVDKLADQKLVIIPEKTLDETAETEELVETWQDYIVLSQALVDAEYSLEYKDGAVWLKGQDYTVDPTSLVVIPSTITLTNDSRTVGNLNTEDDSNKIYLANPEALAGGSVLIETADKVVITTATEEDWYMLWVYNGAKEWVTSIDEVATLMELTETQTAEYFYLSGLYDETKPAGEYQGTMSFNITYQPASDTN